MTRLAPPLPEPLDATPRRAMTDNRKARAYALAEGVCWWCRKPVAKGEAQYDHRIPVWLGGKDDDGPNVAPLHADPYHKAKTRKDAAIRAKTKRVKAKHEGLAPPPLQQIKSAGFRRRWG